MNDLIPNGPELPLGLTHFITQADALALGVLGLLLVMSVASWTQILAKSWAAWRRRRRSRAFLIGFRERASVTAADLAPLAQRPSEPFARLALAGLSAQAGLHPLSDPAAPGRDTPIVRALVQTIAHETIRLESGLTLLASIASTAPFVGLFGTVWGIYHALLGIGRAGQGSLDQVAGPVGEALIMTGLGLAVAIPAVLAYNAFNRGNRVLIDRLEGFAHDLLSFLAGHVRDAGAGVAVAEAG
ncbi:MotA/TolQ/ExbB proton channel family protein [uncultured Thiodictyon sp.]|uniref:MotA/TolQ/ExbB proton channel family protein n=1 Tax=uncultured Thiodictyon sp. TaxID=1846217 RepID=UPI0025E28381|nr:MotA/TolQ/ExbB proton channel family protein [uncultured Thiodictyon sp.]